MDHSTTTGAHRDGVAARMPIATPEGWRAAAQLRVGDAVWCLDDSPQPVLSLHRHWQRACWDVRVPPLALGNTTAVFLSPEQPVALDLDQAAQLYGDPVALMPAKALIGWRGIGPARSAGGAVMRLEFAKRQVIYAGPGLLLGCPAVDPPGLRPQGPPAPPLTAEQARHLMACVMAEEVGTGLR